MGGRLLIAIILVLFSLGAYYFGTQEVYNPVTEETQRVSLTVDQEIQLGLQAAPQMARQFGGLHPNSQWQSVVDEVGQHLVANSVAADTPYRFEFHVLADEQTVNAFALPGGQIFITAALLQALETEGQLAGVLAHEIGHVVGRHAAEQMAKARLMEGLAGAAGVVLTDPENPDSAQAAQLAAVVAQLVNMRHSREDELESDRLGVRIMADAGYDPRALIRVMEILAEASGGRGGPEFFSTHPNPDNRIAQIEAAIAREFPNGLPADLTP
ncbi:peptidase M48 Ste24p [Litorilinea aerophila]|nr:peptidase M48 Ste24p [Litorilinea aerophila]